MGVKISINNLQQKQFVSNGTTYPANDIPTASAKPVSLLNNAGNSAEIPINLDFKKAADEQNAKKQIIEGQIKALISELKGKPSESRSQQILQEIQSLVAGSGANINFSSLLEEAKQQSESNNSAQQTYAAAAIEKQIKEENKASGPDENNIIDSIVGGIVEGENKNDTIATKDKTNNKSSKKTEERQIKKSEAVKKASETVLNKFAQNYGTAILDSPAIQEKKVNMLDSGFGEAIRKQEDTDRRAEQLISSDANAVKFKENMTEKQKEEFNHTRFKSNLADSGVSSVESSVLLFSLYELKINFTESVTTLSFNGEKTLEGKDLLDTLQNLNLAPTESRSLINKIAEKQQEKEIKNGVVDGRDLIDILGDLNLSHGKLSDGKNGSRVDVVKSALKNNPDESLQGAKLLETIDNLGLSPEERASVVKKMSEKNKEKEAGGFGLASLFGEKAVSEVAPNSSYTKETAAEHDEHKSDKGSKDISKKPEKEEYDTFIGSLFDEVDNSILKSIKEEMSNLKSETTSVNNVTQARQQQEKAANCR